MDGEAMIKKKSFHSKEELQDYLKKEIENQGKNVVIRDLDVSGIEDLNDLFVRLLIDVETLDLSGWNLKGVKNMYDMFSYASPDVINLSGWNVSSVTDMCWMFSKCVNLKSLDLSGWDTSEVDNMSGMFYCCDSLESLDLSGLDIGKVKNMSWMFEHCRVLKSLDLSGWETNDIASKDGMFKDCPAPYEVVDNKIVRNNKRGF